MTSIAQQVVLRPATMNDARSIATIHVNGRRAAYGDFLPAELLGAVTVESRTREWVALFRDPPPGASAWVAELEDRVVGFTLIADGQDADVEFGGEIRLLYVEPALRGAGAGSVLFDLAVQSLRARGLNPYLYTLCENEAGRRFYERHGWWHDGVTRPFPPDVPVTEECRYRPSD